MNALLQQKDQRVVELEDLRLPLLLLNWKEVVVVRLRKHHLLLPSRRRLQTDRDQRSSSIQLYTE